MSSISSTTNTLPICNREAEGYFQASPSSFLSSLESSVRTMARLAVAGCCALGLYFLLVCLVTGHSTVLLTERSSVNTAKSPLPLRYESTIESTIVDEILLKNEDDSKESHNKLRSKTKLGSNNPTDRHRYTLSDGPSSEDEEKENDQITLASSYSDCSYHLAFTLIEGSGGHNNNHQKRSKLLTKFRNALSSILLHLNSSDSSGAFCIHLITDGGSLRAAINDVIVRVHEHLVETGSNDHHHHHKHSNFDDENDHHRPLTKYFFIDSAAVEAKLERLLPTLRRYFTHKPESYYSSALFFYSLVLHQVIPASVADRLVLLDVDVQVEANLLQLYETFGRFTSDQVMAIAHEQQPVYRHILTEYRRTHENTTAGSAPSSSPGSSPSGFPGYNSGVLLLDLGRMRASRLYNSLFSEPVISHLARKYRFRGHLGDQDFYTLAALDFGQLFYTLPCSWNRQLCQWWRFHGYGAVFEDYHRCESSVKLYHGNCNSALP